MSPWGRMGPEQRWLECRALTNPQKEFEREDAENVALAVLGLRPGMPAPDDEHEAFAALSFCGTAAGDRAYRALEHYRESVAHLISGPSTEFSRGAMRVAAAVLAIQKDAIAGMIAPRTPLHEEVELLERTVP